MAGVEGRKSPFEIFIILNFLRSAGGVAVRSAAQDIFGRYYRCFYKRYFILLIRAAALRSASAGSKKPYRL